MESKIGYKDILRQKEYMKMILAAIINRFGDSVEAIAFTWIVYEITNDAAWSALIFGLNLVPTIIITPFAGAWVERKRKKPIMVITDLIRAACVACIATAYFMGFLQPWMLIITTLIISTVEAFRGPANTALTPQILDKKYYDYGMSLMSSLTSVVKIVGTALAAGIITLIGSAGAIYLDMITFLLSAFIILFVKVKEEKTVKEQETTEEKESYWSILISGMKYVAKKQVIIFTLGIAIFLNAVLTPLNSLEAPLANEILGAGVEVLSVISITITVGMMAGTIIYPKIKERVHGKILVFMASAGIGVYYLGIVVGRPFYGNRVFLYGFLVALSAMLGLLISLLSSFTSVEFVKRVDEAYLARAGAIADAFQAVATPLVAFVISGIMVFADTTVIFVVTGLVAIIVSIPLLFTKVLDEAEEKTDENTELANVKSV